MVNKNLYFQQNDFQSTSNGMKLKILILVCSLAFSLLLPFTSLLAADPATPPSDVCNSGNLKTCVGNGLNNLGGTFKGAGPVNSSDVAEKVGSIISFILAFVGVIFLFLIVISGIQWMISGEKGEKEKISKAQSRIKNAAIGLIITLAAYAITYFVVAKLSESLGNNTQQNNPTSSCNTIYDCTLTCTPPQVIQCVGTPGVCLCN
jgi:hypothetical protein